jgi:tetratricopeptide (TPR) repeat protein
VLEGSVRKAGNTFRVTAQLIRADNGVHQWSDSYDRNLKDIFKVQDEIAASVVRALQATLLAHVPRAERDSANIDSYTRMLQARFLIGRGSEADTRQSIVVLERALALDPSYAPAWTELSRAHAFLDAQVDSTPGANIVQARAAAEKALALDPASADAHAALADIKLNYDLDAQGAAAETDAARRADPDTPRPDLLSLYSGCIAGPCYAELIGDLSRIVNRDPLNADAYAKRALARRLGGQLADAEHDARRALQLSPQRSSGYSALTETLIVRHDLGNLLATAQLEPSGPHHRWAVALAYQALGRRADAQRALEDLVRLDAANWAFQIGQVYAMRGEVAESLDWLERAYRQHDQGLWVLKVDQTLASIHGDPRYQALLRKMGLSR